MAKPRHGNLSKQLAEESNVNYMSDNEEVVVKKSLSKKGILGRADKEYNKKLAGEKFNEFTHKDWLKYFYAGYKRINGESCYIPKSVEEKGKYKAIMQGIMKATKPLELKTIIDFLFSNEQSFKLRRENISVYDLAERNHSKLKIQSKQWKEGTYKNTDQLFENTNWKKPIPKRAREWSKGSPSTNEFIIS